MLFVKFLVKEPQVLNWVHNFFFFFKGANIDWPISNSFGTLGMAPIEAPLWTPSCKIYTVVLPYVLPFQFIYMGVELWANHMGQNPGAIGNILENALENSLRTWWEHIGNKWKIQKIPLPTPPQKEKNWTTHECMLSLHTGCMKLTVPHHFSPRLMAGGEFWGHRMTIGFLLFYLSCYHFNTKCFMGC
jgi:hypothetical protein